MLWLIGLVLVLWLVYYCCYYWCVCVMSSIKSVLVKLRFNMCCLRLKSVNVIWLIKFMLGCCWLMDKVVLKRLIWWWSVILVFWIVWCVSCKFGCCLILEIWMLLCYCCWKILLSIKSWLILLMWKWLCGVVMVVCFWCCFFWLWLVGKIVVIIWWYWLILVNVRKWKLYYRMLIVICNSE